MKKIRFALTTIKIFMKNQMQNKTYLLLDMINMLSRCVIVFLLYGYVFSLNDGNINGLDYKTSLWSMFIYFCIMTLKIRNIDTSIMNDVKSGNVEMFMNKPISYVIYSFYRTLGQGLYSFLVISFVGTILMIMFVGLPNVTLSVFIPIIILTLILGMVLGLLMYSIIGLISFMIQDIRPIHWIVDKLVMVLGGSYLPVAMFPNFMKLFAYISPFGAVNFATSTVYNDWNDQFIIRIGIQILWILISYLILKLVFRKVKIKSMVNGG